MGKHEAIREGLLSVFAKYKKAIIGATGAIAAAVVAALGGGISFPEIVNIVIIAVGAISVGIAPDLPDAKYVKNALAGIAAAAVVLLSVYSGGISGSEWGQIIVAFATAAGIISSRNRGDNLERELNAKV